MSDAIREHLEQRAARALKLEGWEDSRALGNALVAVLEIHVPYPVRYHPTVRKTLGPARRAEEGKLRCSHCHGYGEIENLPYPCPTVQAIAVALGVGECPHPYPNGMPAEVVSYRCPTCREWIRE